MTTLQSLRLFLPPQQNIITRDLVAGGLAWPKALRAYKPATLARLQVHCWTITTLQPGECRWVIGTRGRPGHQPPSCG